MGTCVLDWQGETLKVIAREQDLAGLPEAGPMWVSWPDAAGRPIKG